MANHKDSRDIHISGVSGDIIGVGVSGEGNIVGKNVVIGSGSINVSDQRFAKIQNNEYVESLKNFSKTINERLNGRQISEDKLRMINNTINELAKETEDIEKGKRVSEIDYVKRTAIESKTATLVQQVLRILPTAVETAAAFSPLAPFSKLIGKGVQQIVDAVKNR